MQAATEINQNGNTQAERGINSENHVFSNRPEQSPSQSLSRTWLDPFLFIVAKQNNDEAGKPVRLLAGSQHSAFPRGHNSHYDSSDRAADDYLRHCEAVFCFQLIISKALCFSILRGTAAPSDCFSLPELEVDGTSKSLDISTPYTDLPVACSWSVWRALKLARI